MRVLQLFFALFIAQGDVFSASTSLPIHKVVIWGHKLHTHTHSYIHLAFYRAFCSLGYDTYWFDNSDNVESFDFSNTLFITEWQVDAKIPIRLDSFYLVHNMYEDYDHAQYHGRITKYLPVLALNRASNFRGYQVGKRDERCKQLDNYTYYNLEDKTVYILWGTDLLPHEIDEIKKTASLNNKENRIYWIGTIGAGEAGNIDQIEPFQRACKENGIAFIHRINCSGEENLALIQKSYCAPALQGKGQVVRGYIPCRIFKNISYGQPGITNSKEVYDLFNGKIIYNDDTYQLFFDIQKKIKLMSLQDLYEQMDFVKENHTYLNRIQSLLTFLEMVYQSDKG